MSDAHWTERSSKQFRYNAALDYIALIEALCAAKGLSDSEIAKMLKISVETLRDTLNGQRTQTLTEMIEWSRALGLKLSILVYDDNDPDNLRGPIPAQLFVECWKRAGKPKDFWDLEGD